MSWMLAGFLLSCLFLVYGKLGCRAFGGWGRGPSAPGVGLWMWTKPALPGRGPGSWRLFRQAMQCNVRKESAGHCQLWVSMTEPVWQSHNRGNPGLCAELEVSTWGVRPPTQRFSAGQEGGEGGARFFFLIEIQFTYHEIHHFKKRMIP